MSKLPRKPFSNATFEREERDRCRCFGKRYPISGPSARCVKRELVRGFYADLADVCPN